MSPAAAEAAASSDLLTTKRKELLSLSNQKHSLELEVNAIISELTSPITITTTNDSNTTTTAPPMGIDTPLVDNEGYPRSDIDVYRVRSLRKRFHEIKTDYRVVEGRIERGLLELSALRDAETSGGGSGGDASKSMSKDKVNEAQEIQARRAPKPKPKFDPVTGKWVVKSWDGSVAGVENGEVRKFEDLSHSSEGALASIAGIAGSGGSGSAAAQQEQQGSSSFQQRPTSSSATASSTEQTSSTSSSSSSTQQTIALTPFAIIDQVFANSPSQEAGIQEGDLLVRFGTVTSDNHGDFNSIKRAIVTELSLAAANECSISVAVRRTTSMLGGVAEMIRTETFDLTPREWAGKGLLGCHLQ
eukprot:CAMPEP_0201689366 /NCGR_PEP_ID=MMETSP0578-20130828/2974_1 /ASSEMBLY_ACC=CAM_ASM_000663 /TAXON_ID=267565 /ORGANISM="Skeletonema grethea, Strain CCMP 1804" /LENGTH=358 /DNA_ID=CAMNT_0048173989 /DNA_START=25 /DNA_END=1098 /DNA_ORIENTATION=+